MNKSILDRPEYRFLSYNEYLGQNVVLLGLGGSHAYGTNVEGSDIDVRGVAVRSKFAICTGYDFEEVVNNETDTTVYSFDKMLKLLADCNPNCIEILGLREEDYLKKSYVGKLLIDNKKLFLSKRCINTFGGYATQQLYRLRQKTLDALTPDEYNEHIAKVIAGMSEHLENSWHISPDRLTVKAAPEGLKVDIKELENISLEDFYGMCNEISNTIRTYNKNSKRNDHALAHSKINKHAMHLFRLYLMAVDLLERREIVTYREADHDLLMAIRNGEFTDSTTGMMSKTFWDLLAEVEQRFQVAKQVTTLPNNPDMESIRLMQYDVNSYIVKGTLPLC